MCLQLHIPKTLSRPMREGTLLGRNTVMASIYFFSNSIVTGSAANRPTLPNIALKER